MSTTATSQALYICVVLSDTTVQAALFSLGGAKGATVEKTSATLQFKDSKEAVVKVDQSLQDLGKASEGINDVIFALPQAWVLPEGLADERKPLLKNITEDLGLQPVGFVVVSEVIQEALSQSKADTLLLLLTHTSLTVSLVTGGEFISSEMVGRSDDVTADSQEALTRIRRSHHQKHLPSRIIVTSVGLEDEVVIETQQALLGVDWKSSGLFLDQPLIDVIHPEVLLQALILQAAKAVAQVKGMHLPSEPEELKADEMGFTTVNPHQLDEETAVQTSFGVPIKSIVMPHVAGVNEESMEESGEGVITEPKPRRKSLFSNFKLPKKMPFIMGGFAAGVLVLILVAILAIQSTAQLFVSVTLKTQAVASEALITLDPDVTTSSPEELILKASVVQKKMIGDKSIETTGAKLVGEKAQGKITLFNKTDSVKTFSKGTQLKKDKFLFTLDEDVTVASASVETSNNSSETKTYGKADGNVTATAIGAEYNLAKNTELQIGDFSGSTYTANVADGLTNGSSREIRVVSPEDKKKLQAELDAELLKKAEEEFADNSGNGTYQLSTGRKKTIEAEFSAKEGDETKTLALALEIEVEGVTYAAEDLKPLAQEILKDKIPDGFALTDEPPSILSQPEEAASSSAKVVLDANVSAKTKPQLTADEVKASIAGKNLAEALTILKGKSEFSAVEITIKPKLASFLVKRVPKDPSKIQVELK